MTAKIDSSIYFAIRNARTHEQIGWKCKDSPRIFVPIDGELENFIVRYGALTNYNMGNAIELYDTYKKTVDRFVILYAFKRVGLSTISGNIEYDVLEAEMGNLEMLEIIDIHNKKEFLNVDPTTDAPKKQ